MLSLLLTAATAAAASLPPDCPTGLYELRALRDFEVRSEQQRPWKLRARHRYNAGVQLFGNAECQPEADGEEMCSNRGDDTLLWLEDPQGPTALIHMGVLDWRTGHAREILDEGKQDFVLRIDYDRDWKSSRPLHYDHTYHCEERYDDSSPDRCLIAPGTLADTWDGTIETYSLNVSGFTLLDRSGLPLMEAVCRSRGSDFESRYLEDWHLSGRKLELGDPKWDSCRPIFPSCHPR
jgi:hypothetical protein